MPQMAPLNWFILFIFFFLIFILFNTINYFMFFYSPQNKISLNNKTTKTLNWKW